MLFSTLFNTIIRSWIRFKDSIYKDESYLTHTLPVTKTEIYESRFIQTIIFTIIGFIFILVSLCIAYYSKENWLALKVAMSEFAKGLNVNTLTYVLLIVFVFFLEIMNAIQAGYFGIIVGHRYNNNKIVLSFAFGLAGYAISQTITILFVFIVGLFNSSIMDLFKNTVLLDNNAIIVLLITSIVSYIIVNIIMNTICCKALKKGVNVE